MLSYKLNLNLEALTHIHELLELAEQELEDAGDQKGAFKYYQTRKLVEEQLEKQGVHFVAGEDGQE